MATAKKKITPKNTKSIKASPKKTAAKRKVAIKKKAPSKKIIAKRKSAAKKTTIKDPKKDNYDEKSEKTQ